MSNKHRKIVKQHSGIYKCEICGKKGTSEEVLNRTECKPVEYYGRN